MRRLLIYNGILPRRLWILQYLPASSAVQSCVLGLALPYPIYFNSLANQSSTLPMHIQNMYQDFGAS
jgi:hypothetical protein